MLDTASKQNYAKCSKLSKYQMKHVIPPHTGHTPKVDKAGQYSNKEMFCGKYEYTTKKCKNSIKCIMLVTCQMDTAHPQ